MLRDSQDYPEGRLAHLVRQKPVHYDATSTDLRALLQELVATRLHLALVANEHDNPPESARALARSFLNERFPGTF